KKLTLEQLREVEDRAILAALDLQRQVGLDVFTDGEYRRRSWAGDFAEAVEGYVPGPPPVTMHWGGAQVRPQPSPSRAVGVVGEKLRQKRRLTAHESGFLKQHAPGPWKVTLPAASYVVARGYKPGITDTVYPTRADLLADVVAIIRAEIQALVEEGAPYIQVDNPHYPDYIDENRREQWRAMGIDPDQALAEDIAADNASLEGIDRSRVTIGVHICRGNSRSSWHTQGGYERIAEPVFGTLNVDRFLLEYDSERAGGFEPLRFVSRKDLRIVLGLVTSKFGELEAKDDLKRRIDEATRYVPLEQLCLSPQCGFASTEEGNLLTEEQQWDKLRLVVETAHEVWG
ncbi:MAG: 5-methyltetrahydropteroyltriglutamate--homocysteine methyltransferase, partial [Alicyclobacillus shizuokensis]|nr:5-methyltetrahydropteroyltriglutamate--homocysteine methyltransferase [Alicyclobacillus shizuokensis]